MAPLALPGKGKSKAADITTITTTTSASVEASNSNRLNNIDSTVDSGYDPLFDDEMPNYSSDYVSGECGATNTASDIHDFMLPGGTYELLTGNMWSIAARSDSTSDQSTDITGSGHPSCMHTEQDPATAANDNTPAPTSSAPIELALPATAPVVDTPAASVPVKRPRGRPPGKAPPKKKVTYRCRYGCERHHEGGVSLRKHMMRVHGIFSSAHTVRKCSICERTYDPNIKDLICNKPRFCPKLSDEERSMMNVQYPRDDQETADTFAYDGSDPSALVIVEPGDDETELLQACADAIENWPDAVYSRPQARDSLVAPEINVPAPSPPAYEGKGKKRAVDAPSQEEPAPKRAERVVPVSVPQSSHNAFYAVSGVENAGFVGESNMSQGLTSDNGMPYSITGENAHIPSLAANLVNQYDQVGTSPVGESNGFEGLTFDNEMPSRNSEENIDISDLATDLLNEYNQMFSDNASAEENVSIPTLATDPLNEYNQMFSEDVSNSNTEDNVNVSDLAADLLNDYNQMFSDEALNDITGFD